MEVIKKIQTIASILFELKSQIAIILCLFCVINVLLSIVILNKSTKNTNTINNSRNIQDEQNKLNCSCFQKKEETKKKY